MVRWICTSFQNSDVEYPSVALFFTNSVRNQLPKQTMSYNQFVRGVIHLTVYFHFTIFIACVQKQIGIPVIKLSVCLNHFFIIFLCGNPPGYHWLVAMSDSNRIKPHAAREQFVDDPLLCRNPGVFFLFALRHHLGFLLLGWHMASPVTLRLALIEDEHCSATSSE